MTQDQARASGRVLAGRYAMLSEIGRGGMGIVWLAEDQMIGRRVAIKELHLPDDVAPDEKTVYEERVLREARAAGRLNDPGVVTVYDVLRESDTTFIVMELIQATTLSQLVQDQGPLAQDTVARLAEQLLDALQSAHAAGVVHRDVKPSNIMVLPNGRVKLTDFGIAQSTDDPHLTTSGILVGSPVYMAPERLRGADADAGSDLWALGAVLFFAVEGYAAFERSSTAATMHAILNEVPYLTRGHGPLAAVITGLLNSHPEARPSAAQVRGLLAQATGTPPEGITAAVTTPAAPLPRARRARWSRLVIGAVVAVALLVAGYFIRVATEGPEPVADMDPTLTYGTGEDGYIKELTWDSSPEGGCLISELVEGRRITQSQHVECTEPHVLESFAGKNFYDMPDDEYDKWKDIGYPGVGTLTVFAESYCSAIFRSEVVADRSSLRYRALVPTEDAWDTRRTVYCFLYNRDGEQLDTSFVVPE